MRYSHMCWHTQRKFKRYSHMCWHTQSVRDIRTCVDISKNSLQTQRDIRTCVDIKESLWDIRTSCLKKVYEIFAHVLTYSKKV